MLIPFSIFAMVSRASEVVVQEIPGTLAKFSMVRIEHGTDAKSRKANVFWIAQTETTWDCYDVFTYRLDLSLSDQAQGVDAKVRPSRPYGAPDRGYGHAGFPALAMTLHAAQAYCVWLSKKTGNRYRLPSEEEWDAALRFGINDTSRAAATTLGWFAENSGDSTHPVGSKSPMSGPLSDLVGNVAEWCVAADGTGVVKGGHFRSTSEGVLSGWREVQAKSWNVTDPQIPKSLWWLADAPFIGFRVVREH